MRALPFAAPLLLASFALAGAAWGADAKAPALNGVHLGQYAAGPRVTAKDLKGRVVVFEYWGNECPPCKKAIPHVAALQAKYPHQSLIVIANQSWEGDAVGTARIWAAHGGGNKVAVIHGGRLPNAKIEGVPHAFVFDAAGKLVYEGYPSERMDKAVEAAIKDSPAGLGAGVVFGDTPIPAEFQKIALQMTDTTKSCALAHQQLERAAAAKDAKQAESAKAMLAAFKAHVADRCAELPKLAEDGRAAEAWALTDTLALWVPHLEEGVKAQKQKAEWRRNGTFLRELAADKAWLALKAQADKIGFEKNPKAKPTSQLESDYKKMLKDKDFAATKALARAKAAAEEWKLDPETGRADKFKPKPKAEPAPAANP